MSKFNVATSSTRTVNYAGGEAFTQTPKLQFVSLLLTSFVKDQYYRSEADSISEVSRLIDAIPDKRFVAKTAVYARTKFGMRSVSHVVAAELAKRVKGEQWTKGFFDKIIYRPDDMTEILAYYYAQGAKNEPNALKKGFARAFTRFDEYHLAKYRKEGSAVSLIDVANLVHPAHSEAIQKLIKGTLPTPQTWETQLTAAGQSEDVDGAKKQAWVSLIKERKIGYFALLRNLRNILEQAPEVITEACALLVDEKLIRQSLVLPFRFSTAIEEIEQVSGVDTSKVREVLVALNGAIDKATANVPRFEGSTLVVVDVSSSMNGQPIKIASLFAAVMLKQNVADFMMFAGGANYVNYNPMDSTLSIARAIEQQAHGGSTNFHAVFQEANKAYDRIIILSDMQGWVGYDAPTKTFAEYKTRCGANPHIYSFDLQGQGTMQFPEQNVYCLAGFSEKVFDVMKLLEQDKQALISEIEKVEL